MVVSKSSSSRRLSVGRTLLDESSDEGDSDDANAAPNNKRPKPSARSRKSVGKPLLSTAAVAESAEEVAEMYRTVIKMASENKINVKNAWNLKLIDHMQDVVNEEEEEDEQQDDGRLLSLDNTNKPEEKEGRRSSVNFQKASCTLDAGVKIYCSRVDDTWATSHRVLESLQRNREAGSQDKEQEEEEQEEEEEEEQEEKEKAPKKPRRPKAALATLATSSSQIDQSAEEVLEDEADAFFSRLSQQGFDGGHARSMLLQRLTCSAAVVSFGHSDEEQSSSTYATETLLTETVKIDAEEQVTTVCKSVGSLRLELQAAKDGLPFAASEEPPPEANYDLDDDDEDEASAFYGGGAFDDDDDDDSTQAPPPDGGATFAFFASEENAGGEDDEHLAPRGLRMRTNLVDDNFAYFEPAALKGNNWAGIAHWKRAVTRQPKAAAPAAAKPRKKAAPALDWASAAPEIEGPVKAKKRDVTQQTLAAQNKALSESRKLMLPEDLGITRSDLNCLFLVDVALSSSRKQEMVVEEEEYQGSSNYDDPGDDDDDDDNFGGDGGGFLADLESASFDNDDDSVELLAATRVVENVSISFATSAKRVDVRKLKTALWREIEDGTRNDPEQVLGFSDLVRGVANKKQQADVTMPFYFICLLHLCNEKNLALIKNDDVNVIDDFDLKKNITVN